MGVSYIHPDGEGEAYASELCRIGYVDYVLTEDIASATTGEVIALKNQRVAVKELQAPIGSFSNINIYRVKHSQTNQDLYITNGDICR